MAIEKETVINKNKIENFINSKWDTSILPVLKDYIRIPCKSQAYDANWQTNGYIDQAMELFVNWAKQQDIKGMQLSVERIEGRSPVLFIEVTGQSNKTVLLYGHMDKQPEMTGWDADLGPWQPVLKNDRLYGRGAADDGYAMFAAITAIKALQAEGIQHDRYVILIEASEESGSIDLPFYFDHLAKRIGTPDLIIGLDSGCGNYEQFWSTTSLRGNVVGELKVEILTEGVHSGASGIVPSSFRIIRQLLSRIEDEKTGEILIPELRAKIPEQRIEQAKLAANILGENVWKEYPFVEGARSAKSEYYELILNRTWQAALSIIGAGYIPDLANAGNVLRPKTSLMLSMRIPPTTNADAAFSIMKKVLEADPPYGAKVSFTTSKKAGAGWNAPAMKPWLTELVENTSRKYFGKPAAYWGEGGSIPFMGMLGEKFPQAQFIITGVLGPKSNAHGPNEFLYIPYVKKLTCCIAEILANYYQLG